VGSGPSLIQADIDLAYDSGAHLLAINDAWRLTGPRASVLFAADGEWWKWNRDVPDTDLPWHRWACDPDAQLYRRSVHIVNYNGKEGLETEPSSIRTGGHSGYMAINMAVHFGARLIVLLGYDLKPTDGKHHFFGDHPNGHHLNYAYRRGVYETLAAPLAALSIRIVNASRSTALTAFPQCVLTDALAA
jgi:hypothetical protein